jgi:hypothetical protein
MVRHQAKQETSILALFFSPKDEGVIFLWNISWPSAYYIALYRRR